MRLGSFDGLDGHAGGVVRGLLGEALARLDRAVAERKRGTSLARTIAGLDKPAVATKRDVARAPLEAILEELSLALGALGQANGALAAERARGVASRLASSRRRRPPRAPVDPEVTKDVAELKAGRLPQGFGALSVVSALLA